MYQYLLNQFGVRLTLDEVAGVLKVPIGTIYNKRSKNELSFRTYKDGLRVFVDTKDLADYLDKTK
jgi:Helix-turn-helix domain